MYTLTNNKGKFVLLSIAGILLAAGLSFISPILFPILLVGMIFLISKSYNKAKVKEIEDYIQNKSYFYSKKLPESDAPKIKELTKIKARFGDKIKYYNFFKGNFNSYNFSIVNRIKLNYSRRNNTRRGQTDIFSCTG